MSSFVSWDSKITTVNALLGGVSDLVRKKMKTDGIYDNFIAVTQVRDLSLMYSLLGSRPWHTGSTQEPQSETRY
jgi:hypothetical protein